MPARGGTRRRRTAAARAAPRHKCRDAVSATPAAANDNAIVRIAREIRHAVNGWRHGAAVDAFAAERTQVMAAWDELRRRARAQGDAVALSPAFRETLDRHGALMKQAASFRRRPQVFECLLAERAGIGEDELQQLRHQQDRASRYLRSVKASASHAARQDVQVEEARVETVPTAAAAHAFGPPVEERVPAGSVEAAHLASARDAMPDWLTLYTELQRNWNALVARAEASDLPLPLMDGYDGLIQRVRALADHPDLSRRARSVLASLLEYDTEEAAAREIAEGYLAAAEQHVEAYNALERQAGECGIPVAELAGWPDWHRTAGILAETGEAVLADKERYDAYLDAMTNGKARARLTVDQLRNRLRERRVETPAPRQEPVPEQRGFADRLNRSPTKPLSKTEQEKGFAYILDDPEKLRELREKAEKEDRKLGRHMRRSRGISM